MSQFGRFTKDENIVKTDQFYVSRVTSEIMFRSKNHSRCTKKNSALMIFSTILTVFWIAFIFLAYAVYHPKDFVDAKPLKIEQYPLPRPPLPVGQNQFLFTHEKKTKYEHFEYLTDFRSDEIFKNIWITLLFCIIGILVSISALHGILENNPYFLDPCAYFLFAYGVHKLCVAVCLILMKCPGRFIGKHIIFTDLSMILLDYLDVRIPVIILHLILAVMSFCVLSCLTKFRNQLVKKNLIKSGQIKKELEVFVISTTSLSTV